MAFYGLIELKKAKFQLLCDKPSRVRMRYGGPLIALGDHLWLHTGCPGGTTGDDTSGPGGPLV